MKLTVQGEKNLGCKDCVFWINVFAGCQHPHPLMALNPLFCMSKRLKSAFKITPERQDKKGGKQCEK